MKLSERTIKLLKNYQSINPGITLMPGGFLSTKTDPATGTGEVFARADIEEDFPQEFPIYDLGSFINTINLMGEDTELDFQDKYVLIKSGTLSFKFHKTADDFVHSPKNKKVELQGPIEFDITESILKKMEKLSNVNNLPLLSMEGKSGSVLLRGYTGEGDNCLEYSLGDYDGEDFKITVIWDHVRIISRDYRVQVMPEQFIRFKTSDKVGAIDYVIGLKKE